MKAWRQFLFRLQMLLRRKQIESELSEEIESHIQLSTEANIAAGMPEQEARAAAIRELGGVDQLKESYRDERGFPWAEQFFQDLRFAGRSLIKSPGFALVAILSFGVAIAVVGTGFTLINGLILRPLAPTPPEELVSIYTSNDAPKVSWRRFSYEEFMLLREAREMFTDLGASMMPLIAGIEDPSGLRRRMVFVVSDSYFSTLGVRPVLGRFFNAEESKPNTNIPVVVASYALWERHGKRDDFVGSPLKINGQYHTVIGIAPRGFNGLNVLFAPDIWAPLGSFGQFGSAMYGSWGDLADSKKRLLLLTARLAPGVTMESLPTRLPALAERLTALQLEAGQPARKLQGQSPSRSNISFFPTSDESLSVMARGLGLVSTAVVIIASFNLGNMLLARGNDRRRELAVRLAMGATRARIVRMLCTEGLLIALLGGVLGFLLSQWINALLFHHYAAALGSQLSVNFSLAINLDPDGRVFGVAFLCCFAATLLFSFLPAMRVSRVDVVHSLKQSSGAIGSPGRWARFFALRNGFLVLQIALCFAATFGAGLIVRGAMEAGRVELQFDPDGVLVAEIDYSLKRTEPADAERSMLRLLDQARQQPGVQSASLGTLLPYGNLFPVQSVRKLLGEPDPHAKPLFANYSAITSDYFTVMRIPVKHGRTFTENEVRSSSSSPVTILDQSLAKTLFPNEDPVGQYITMAGPEADQKEISFQVIGIVADHRISLRTQESNGAIFVPLASATAFTRGAGAYLQVRYGTPSTEALALASKPLRLALNSSDPDNAVLQISPYRELIGRNIVLWQLRFAALIFGSFGCVALGLSLLGIFGVAAYGVSRRTHEIGVRRALGARNGSILLMVLRQSIAQTVLGLLLGLGLALGVGRAMKQLLFMVEPYDMPTFIAVAFLMVTAALFACLIPARRAVRVDPLVALRAD